MKRQLIHILLLSGFVSSSCYAQLKQGGFIFANSGYEGPGNIIQTNDGGYIIADERANSYPAYILKLDKDAVPQWTKQMGGSGNSETYSVVQCKGGGYVFSGNTNGYGAGLDDAYVFKLDNGGNLLWTRTIGGAQSDIGYSLIQCSDGGFAIAGISGGSSYDAYIVKLDSLGALQWAKTIGGSGDDRAYSIIQTNDGGLAAVGHTFGAGNFDVYIIKLDASGNLLWTKIIGGPGQDEGESIVQLSNGDLAITGYTTSYGAGNMDVYVIRLSSSGNLRWTRTIGGTNDDWGKSVIQNRHGDLVVVGTTKSFGPGVGANVYLASFDSTGNRLWTKAAGGMYDDAGVSIQQCNDGGYLIGAGSNSFAGGGHYIYILKSDSLGNLCADTATGGTVSTGGIMRIGGGTLVSMGTASSGGTLSASTVTPTTLCSVLGIDEVSTETGMLHVFPNPCSDLLTVELNEAITHFQTIYQVSIYDISGRLIKTFRMRNELPGYSIDVSGFPSGVYYVSVNSPNGIQVKKFIKI